jgi:hypothetical protein
MMRKRHIFPAGVVRFPECFRSRFECSRAKGSPPSWLTGLCPAESRSGCPHWASCSSCSLPGAPNSGCRPSIHRASEFSCRATATRLWSPPRWCPGCRNPRIKIPRRYPRVRPLPRRLRSSPGQADPLASSAAADARGIPAASPPRRAGRLSHRAGPRRHPAASPHPRLRSQRRHPRPSWSLRRHLRPRVASWWLPNA